MVYLKTLALIFLGLLFFMQLLTASWYDLVKKSGEPKRAFKHKLICSLICTAAFLLCAAIGKASMDLFSLLFGIAIVSLFIYDLTSEKQQKAFRIISALLSSAAYILIATAFYFKNKEHFSFTPFSYGVRIAIIAAVCVLCFVINIKSQRLSAAISCMYMLINAVLIGISLQKSGQAMNQAASCAVIIGSSCIAISNLLPIFDNADKKSLLRTNMYYFGIMFISCSVAVL